MPPETSKQPDMTVQAIPAPTEFKTAIELRPGEEVVVTCQYEIKLELLGSLWSKCVDCSDQPERTPQFGLTPISQPPSLLSQAHFSRQTRTWVHVLLTDGGGYTTASRLRSSLLILHSKHLSLVMMSRSARKSSTTLCILQGTAHLVRNLHQPQNKPSTKATPSF